MIFRNLTAVFGRLKNDTLKLDDGLNIIELENEGGKSTWSAFISAMLYGVDTSERASSGRLPDKTRFKPWDGGAMEGAMEVEKDGRLLRVERTGRGASPMKQAVITNAATGEEVKLSPEELGRELTGVSREVFVRSALIRQGAMKLDSSADLERQLQALATGSEEDVPYGEAKKRLDDWQKALKNRQGGEISRLEVRAAAADERLSRLNALSERIASARLEADEKESELGEALNELKLHEAHDKANRGREIAKARMEAARLDTELKRVSGGRTPPTRDRLRKLEARVQSCEELAARCAEARETADNAARELNDITPIKSPFDGLSGDEALSRARETVKAAAKARVGRETPAFLTIVILLALATVACFVFLDTALGGIACAFCLCFAVGAWLMTRSTKKRALAILQKKYGPGDIVQAAQDYSDAQKNAQLAELRAKEAASAADELCARHGSLEAEVLAEASDALGGSGTLDEIRPAIDDAYAHIAKLDELFSRYEAACRYRDAISEGFERDDGKYELNAVPVTEKADALARRDAAGDALKDAERRLYELSGELTALGDPDELRAQSESLSAALSVAREEYDALSAAIDALNAANDQLSTRFSPLLASRAAEILRGVTDGKYEKLNLTRELTAGVTERGSAVSRSAAYLSTGAADQLYLSVRLAICSLLLPSDTPLILDDALTSFDPARMARALDYLSGLAETRQIILFTHQPREREYIQSKKDTSQGGCSKTKIGV